MPHPGTGVEGRTHNHLPMSQDAPPRVGFLGAGRMATALARGWLTAELIAADRVVASDPAAVARTSFAKETGLRATEDNRQVVAASDVLILAVKPQSMNGLMAEIKPALNARHLIVSIAAGITLRQLGEGLGSNRLIRVMPNTPCLVGASASAYAAADGAREEDL